MTIIAHQHLYWCAASLGAGLLLLGGVLFETDNSRRFNDVPVTDAANDGFTVNTQGGTMFEAMQLAAVDEDGAEAVKDILAYDGADTSQTTAADADAATKYYDTVSMSQILGKHAAKNTANSITTRDGFCYDGADDPQTDLSICPLLNLDPYGGNSEEASATIQETLTVRSDALRRITTKTVTVANDITTKTIPKHCAGYGEQCTCNAAHTGPASGLKAVIIVTVATDESCIKRGKHCSWFEAMKLGRDEVAKGMYAFRNDGTQAWKDVDSEDKDDATAAAKLAGNSKTHTACKLTDTDAAQGIHDSKNIQCWCHSSHSFQTQTQALADFLTGADHNSIAQETNKAPLHQVKLFTGETGAQGFSRNSAAGNEVGKYRTTIKDVLKLEKDGDPVGNMCYFYNMYHGVYQTTFHKSDPIYWLTLAGAIFATVLFVWHGAIYMKWDTVASNADSVFAIVAHLAGVIFIWLAATAVLTAVATTQCFAAEETDNWSEAVEAPEVLVIIGAVLFFAGIAYQHKLLRQGLIDDATSPSGTVIAYHVTLFVVSIVQIVFAIIVAASGDTWLKRDQAHCDQQNGLNTVYAVSLFIFAGCALLSGVCGIAELADPQSERTKGLKQCTDVLIWPEYIAMALVFIILTTATTSYNTCSSHANTPGNTDYIYILPLIVGLAGVPFLMFPFARGEGQKGVTGQTPIGNATAKPFLGLVNISGSQN